MAKPLPLTYFEGQRRKTVQIIGFQQGWHIRQIEMPEGKIVVVSRSSRGGWQRYIDVARGKMDV